MLVLLSRLQILSERYGVASRPQCMQIMQELAKLQTLEENANLAAALKLTLQDCDSLQHADIERMPSYGSEQSALMDDFMLALKLQEQVGGCCVPAVPPGVELHREHINLMRSLLPRTFCLMPYDSRASRRRIGGCSCSSYSRSPHPTPICSLTCMPDSL
jgi:hypothetical protein